MSNVFNNYFNSVAKKTNSNIKFSSKNYTDYRSYSNTNTFFLTPTDKKEISLIISSLDSRKSSGPNCIFCKNFKTTEKTNFLIINKQKIKHSSKRLRYN